MENNIAFTMHAGNKEFGQGKDEARNLVQKIIKFKKFVR